MTFISDGCNQQEVKTILLRNNELKWNTINIILGMFTDSIMRLKNWNDS